MFVVARIVDEPGVHLGLRDVDAAIVKVLAEVRHNACGRSGTTLERFSTRKTKFFTTPGQRKGHCRHHSVRSGPVRSGPVRSGPGRGRTNRNGSDRGATDHARVWACIRGRGRTERVDQCNSEVGRPVWFPVTGNCMIKSISEPLNIRSVLTNVAERCILV
jgi:hypothetical protein